MIIRSTVGAATLIVLFYSQQDGQTKLFILHAAKANSASTRVEREYSTNSSKKDLP